MLNERGTLQRSAVNSRRASDITGMPWNWPGAIDSAWDEAHAVAGLGRCDLAAGPTKGAGILLRRALGIFQRIGAGEAAAVAAELHDPAT